MSPFFPISDVVHSLRSPADCRQSPATRRKTNRFALVLFTLTALAGLLVRYLA
ncbi:hypothetical protein [Hymenobacter sp. BRD67]|uniref:hypothetical protein n=1 Tax=Hymenobacter sp. BRD67 TaxID=2675877 RepID=UPI0015661EFC|nr:hypothetical protein [Hymenobacter sp. BRD67]QKG52995.1 hypothetical protein GKZ67_10760 [Hymenobacter sp. BRD67]